jgi:hypothetical protein
MTETKSVIEIVQQLGPVFAGIAAIWWFLSKQVWPWLSVRIDKNADFQQEVAREGMATQKSLALSYQQMANAFTQMSERERRNDLLLSDIHDRVVATRNEELTD